MCRRQCIAIWAEQTQIALRIVAPVPINVVRYERHHSGYGMNPRPTAQTAPIFVFLAQITLDWIGNDSERIQSGHLTSLPCDYVRTILKLVLACVAAVLVKSARRLLSANGTRSSSLFRIHVPNCTECRPLLTTRIGRTVENPWSRDPGSNRGPPPSLSPILRCRAE